jgi:hypothetical protein
MANYFGVDQPFCKNPKMIEYFKSLPKDPGCTPDHQSCWIPSHVIREGDLNFAPLSKYDVERIGVLGCASHSDFQSGSRLEQMLERRALINGGTSGLTDYLILKEMDKQDKRTERDKLGELENWLDEQVPRMDLEHPFYECKTRTKKKIEELRQSKDGE